MPLPLAGEETAAGGRRGTLAASLLSIFAIGRWVTLLPCWVVSLASSLFHELMFSKDTLVQTTICSNLGILLCQAHSSAGYLVSLRRPPPPHDSTSKGWMLALQGPQHRCQLASCKRLFCMPVAVPHRLSNTFNTSSVLWAVCWTENNKSIFRAW